MDTKFTPETIANYLQVPDLTLEVRQTVPSTNTLLRQQAENGAGEGLVLAAVHQTAGRGRRDHTFFSPADTGLYMSILLRPALSAQDSLLLTTCAAAATALAIEDCAGIEARIKWVNDVFCRGRKVCGILTEGAVDPDTGGLRYAIVGIGVNLYPPEGGFPADLPEAGAVFAPGEDDGQRRSQLAGAILNHFFRFYETLTEKPFFQAYRQRSLVLGQPITILERGETRPAIALDLEPDFSLRVREADGTVRCLSSGEVRIRPNSL